MPIKELTNGTKWTKAEYFKEKDLKGVYLATYKIDGLRVIRGNDGKIYSRNSKECKHNLERFNFQDAEFYYKDWSTSSSILRSSQILRTYTYPFIRNASMQSGAHSHISYCERLTLIPNLES